MKNRSIIIGSIVILLLLVITSFVYFGEDRKGPVITVDSTKVQPYAKEQGLEKLLSYATALDDKDGDVSDSLLIENIYVSADFTSAGVIYAARDKSGNVTKLTYFFEYLPTQEELKPVISPTNETTTMQPTTAGSNTATTASEKTTAAQNTKETTTAATVSSESPKITLTTNEVTLKVGSNFNVMSYVSNITDDKDTRDVLGRRVIASGDEVKTDTPGDYIVQVYCTDSDKNASNKEKLIVHVTE